MPDDRSELVELFDPDHDIAQAEPDEVTQGGQWPPVEMLNRWPWWRRNDAVGKVLTLTGVGGLFVALIAGCGALTAAPGTQYFVNQQTVPAPAITVDALGCPSDATCGQRAAPPVLIAAIARAVPSGRVTYALQTVDVKSGRIYRREIDLSAPRTTMRFVSQCVPGAGAVTGQRMTVTINAVSGSAHLARVLPGRRGCSLFAEGTTGSATDLDVQSVEDVATNPAMMVTP